MHKEAVIFQPSFKHKQNLWDYQFGSDMLGLSSILAWASSYTKIKMKITKGISVLPFDKEEVPVVGRDTGQTK